MSTTTTLPLKYTAHKVVNSRGVIRGWSVMEDKKVEIKRFSQPEDAEAFARDLNAYFSLQQLADPNAHP